MAFIDFDMGLKNKIIPPILIEPLQASFYLEKISSNAFKREPAFQTSISTFLWNLC